MSSKATSVAPVQSIVELKQSPLIGVDLSTVSLGRHQLALAEIPFLSYVSLRGDSNSATFVAAVSQTLGVTLPIEPNTVVITDACTLAWCGPDEWMAVGAPDSASEWVAALTKALASDRSQITDVSGGNTLVDISGDNARALMQKATTIDVDARVFKQGSAALSTFAHASALMYQYAEEPAYRIVVRRSYADYIGQWLVDAAAEFEV